MARLVATIAGKCLEANDNGGVLDLSNCQLCQVPDAVYHLMRDVKLKVCDLSANDISKISKKFALKFPAITELNLSHNKMSKLPDELIDCKELTSVDISYNSFVEVPKILLQLPNIKVIKLNNNYIMDADGYTIPKDCKLQEVDIRENPLTDASYNYLSSITDLKVCLSPREKQEWDDL